MRDCDGNGGNWVGTESNVAMSIARLETSPGEVTASLATNPIYRDKFTTKVPEISLAPAR